MSIFSEGLRRPLNPSPERRAILDYLARRMPREHTGLILLCREDMRLDFALPSKTQLQAIREWHTHACPRFVPRLRGKLNTAKTAWPISEAELEAGFGFVHGVHPWVNNAQPKVPKPLVPHFILWRYLVGAT